MFGILLNHSYNALSVSVANILKAISSLKTETKQCVWRSSVVFFEESTNYGPNGSLNKVHMGS